jgi:hypothetical protein
MKTHRPVLLFTALLAWLSACSSKQASVGDERLKWNRSTLAGDYEKIGGTDARWNDSAKAALADYAVIRSGNDFDRETKLYLIGSAAEEAVKAGCHDPLIQFLYCNFSVRDSARPLPQKQEAFAAMARGLETSGYSPLRKFYGNLSAASLLWQQRDTNLWPQVSQFRRDAMADLAATLEDKNLPLEEAYHAAHELFQILERNTRELTNAYSQIEKPLFQNFPKAGLAYLIKGEFFLEYAWRGRGNATADRVTDAQWQMFKERLQAARAALDQAWSLNPKNPLIPTVMMSVVEGQGDDRAELEKWFTRAMELDTNNYTACHSKLHYLYPQWHGSREEMIVFGRDCVKSARWGGKIPLVLVDAHGDIARALPRDERAPYWFAPDVWADIETAYEKFARLNPDETRFRYPYAAYAVRCRQWDAFEAQIELIKKNGADFNYNYFGGRENFTNLVETVRQARKSQ